MNYELYQMNLIQGKIYAEIKKMFFINGCELPENISIFIGNYSSAPIYYNEKKTIILNTEPEGGYFAQFAYQLAHELTHAYVADKYINRCLSWIIEIVACNISFYALEFLNKSNIQPNGYFLDYVKNNYAHFRTQFEFARAIINDNVSHFVIDCNAVKKAPLIYFLYDNKSDIDIWKILQSYKEWSENYSESKHSFDSKEEHFSSALKSFNEYLKTYSPDSLSNSILFSFGDDFLNNSSKK